MDKAIDVLQVSEQETEDAHFGEDVENLEMELRPSIMHQNDQEVENLKVLLNNKKQAEDNNLA